MGKQIKKETSFQRPARTDENNLAQEVKPRFVEKRKEPRSNRGVPKSAQHKAAISAALKAKWNDPKYVASQKKSEQRAHKKCGQGNDRKKFHAKHGSAIEGQKQHSYFETLRSLEGDERNLHESCIGCQDTARAKSCWR